MFLLPKARKITPFGEQKPVSQVPEECWPLSNRNSRNISIVQLELICEYKNYLRPNSYLLLL